jgi:hypothetical protein
MRMALRCPPTAAEPLVRDREVLQAEELTHEPDLEVVRIHTHLDRHVGNVGDGNDGVVGHRISLLLGKCDLIEREREREREKRRRRRASSKESRQFQKGRPKPFINAWSRPRSASGASLFPVLSGL